MIPCDEDGYYDEVKDLSNIIDKREEEIADLTLQLESAKLEIIELRNQLENASVRYRDKSFAFDHLASSNS